MSAVTKQRLARHTIKTVDELLKEWTEARTRGDVGTTDGGPVIDGLLDARQAAVLWLPVPKKEGAAA